MSKRARRFLESWIHDNLPASPSADPGLIGDLADRAAEDAAEVGIPDEEIREEAQSLFAIMAEALANKGLPPSR
ncbi:DUF768 domain-containing protein [Mesorhizobium sp. WSM4303]|uniref:DUF768 domain-containing protein n=1 Tax=unclassified Mesorhizobium TaxID=325217 RepID=UPI00115C790B|nr:MULTISPECIES: DUF768 domain-containing protein [unclassified Mesorhizobium]TRC98264.1 DUF768 domain-containing protein [Mesorhizobium sp. WSM4306]TRD04241.1 DUF768 domain-containing protein [Mesorhizobium sp. WSM4303]